VSFLSNGHDVQYVPIDYAKRAGVSKFHFTKDAYRYILQVLRMVMYFNPLKVLMPIALWIMTIGVAKLAYDLIAHPFRITGSTVLALLTGFRSRPWRCSPTWSSGRATPRRTAQAGRRATATSPVPFEANGRCRARNGAVAAFVTVPVAPLLGWNSRPEPLVRSSIDAGALLTRRSATLLRAASSAKPSG
jgi:hypothetical protein